jgi:hypothetical protein
VPTLSWMAPRRALSDLLLFESSGELSQFDASEHTTLATRRRWCGFPSVDGTSYPPRRW